MNFEPVTVYLCLGSNLGNREANLATAREMLSQRLRMGSKSSVYDTEPVGDGNQPRFLNQVCQAFTSLPPPALLAVVKGIELRMGRLPAKSNAPRPIDIDILFYGDKIFEAPDLVIPHPRLSERAFVLIPLAEIAPGFVHPVSHKKISQLLADLNDSHEVIKCAKET